MHMHFRARTEDQPGETWQALFGTNWPAYERWYLVDGIEERPTYLEAVTQLKRHMPELVPTYERLCELAGGGDLPARFLTLYRPPAYVTGCSQVVWQGRDPLLIRNYDYSPALCEGTLFYSRWNGRGVMAMLDCLWGVVDGVNESGLVVSLTFGGRRVMGKGFGIPIILRYILEFCETAVEAAAVLKRIPVHMSYNVTVLDATGRFFTVQLAPDKTPYVSEVPIATNHQKRVDWHSFARATATLERERFLYFRVRDPEMTPERLIESFLHSPLYTTAYGHGFGTLYTAVYSPTKRLVRLLWPDDYWEKTLKGFVAEDRYQAFYPGPSPAVVS